ncbi:MAG: nitrile hydratase accessory protein [Rhizobiaceae bacterium]
MSPPDLSALPGIVLVDDEPVFNEPWEAQVFALTVSLHDRGMFSWAEWAETFSREIHSGTEQSYYHHWLDALEILLARKNITTAEKIAHREQAWHDAAAKTPHGEPIELG